MKIFTILGLHAALWITLCLKIGWHCFKICSFALKTCFASLQSSKKWTTCLTDTGIRQSSLQMWTVGLSSHSIQFYFYPITYNILIYHNILNICCIISSSCHGWSLVNLGPGQPVQKTFMVGKMPLTRAVAPCDDRLESAAILSVSVNIFIQIMLQCPLILCFSFNTNEVNTAVIGVKLAFNTQVSKLDIFWLTSSWQMQKKNNIIYFNFKKTWKC